MLLHLFSLIKVINIRKSLFEKYVVSKTEDISINFQNLNGYFLITANSNSKLSIISSSGREFSINKFYYSKTKTTVNISSSEEATFHILVIKSSSKPSAFVEMIGANLDFSVAENTKVGILTTIPNGKMIFGRFNEGSATIYNLNDNLSNHTVHDYFYYNDTNLVYIEANSSYPMSFGFVAIDEFIDGNQLFQYNISSGNSITLAPKNRVFLLWDDTRYKSFLNLDTYHINGFIKFMEPLILKPDPEANYTVFSFRSFVVPNSCDTVNFSHNQEFVFLSLGANFSKHSTFPFEVDSTSCFWLVNDSPKNMTYYWSGTSLNGSNTFELYDYDDESFDTFLTTNNSMYGISSAFLSSVLVKHSGNSSEPMFMCARITDSPDGINEYLMYSGGKNSYSLQSGVISEILCVPNSVIIFPFLENTTVEAFSPSHNFTLSNSLVGFKVNEPTVLVINNTNGDELNLIAYTLFENGLLNMCTKFDIQIASKPVYRIVGINEYSNRTTSPNTNYCAWLIPLKVGSFTVDLDIQTSSLKIMDVQKTILTSEPYFSYTLKNNSQPTTRYNDVENWFVFFEVKNGTSEFIQIVSENSADGFNSHYLVNSNSHVVESADVSDYVPRDFLSIFTVLIAFAGFFGTAVVVSVVYIVLKLKCKKKSSYDDSSSSNSVECCNIHRKGHHPEYSCFINEANSNTSSETSKEENVASNYL